MNCPALAADNTLYTLCSDGVLYALDSLTGKKAWTYTLPEEAFSSPAAAKKFGAILSSSPTIGAGGTVYIASEKVYALDGATGKLKWAYELPGFKFDSSPALGPDGTLYIGALKNVQGNGAGKVIALNRSGGLEWFFDAPQYIQASPAIGDDGTVYIGCGNGILYALNGRGGTLKWKFATGDNIMGCPAIGPDNTLYFGSYDHTFYAVDGITGTQKWAAKLSAGMASSPALGSNGLLYVATHDGLVYALRASDGAKGKRPSHAE